MNKNMLKMFFDSIFPNLEGFIEVRYKINSGEQDIVKRRFFSSKERLIKTLIKSEERIKGYEMWFGVCERAIKSGKKEAIEKVCCLWSDVDSGEQTWRDFEYQPHIIVRSGNGHHLYWLIEPIKVTSKEEVEKVEGIMRGISEKIKGDNTSDVTRILRIPETYNNKDPNNPKKAEIIEYNFDIERYKITDFEKFYKEKPTVIKDGIVIVDNIPQVDIKQYNLPYWVEDAIINGYDPTKHQKYKSRSELDLAVMIALVKAHFSDEMIYSVFLNPEYKISYKTLEKGRHYNSYLETTLKKAKEVRDKKLREFIEKVKKFRDFNEVINAYKKWFHIEDTDYLKIIHAVLISHLFSAKPLWMLIVAPPSGTKTSILRDLSVLEKYNVHMISEITDKTFVSGDKNFSGLLSMIKNGVIVFKDFTTILQLSADSRNEIIQQMREIWDGAYTKCFGTGKVVKWEGKITMLAGCTEVYEVFRQIDQTLGERFLLYRPPHEGRQILACRGIEQIGQEEKMREEIQEAIKYFHNGIEPDILDEISVPKYMVDDIVKVADLVTLIRSGVKRDHRKDVEYVPAPEVPVRMAQQIYLFTKSLAVLHSRCEAKNEDFEIAKKVAVMTVPSKKYKILEYFWNNSNFRKSTSEIAQDLKMPHMTTFYLLEDMWCLGILERNSMENPKWWLKDKVYDTFAHIRVNGKKEELSSEVQQDIDVDNSSFFEKPS